MLVHVILHSKKPSENEIQEVAKYIENVNFARANRFGVVSGNLLSETHLKELMKLSIVQSIEIEGVKEIKR